MVSTLHCKACSMCGASEAEKRSEGCGYLDAQNFFKSRLLLQHAPSRPPSKVLFVGAE
jgi:hypothetical protein